MTAAQFCLSLATVGAVLLVLGTPAATLAVAETETTLIDIVAERTFLRTGLGDGAEVADPFIGEQLFLHVEYRVDGSSTPVSAEVRGLIDGIPLCVGAVDLQPQGRFQVWCQNVWRATPGLHTLRWEIDATDAIPESNEQNNVAEAVIDVPSPVLDVVAERAFLRTEPGGGIEIARPAVGQQVFFHLDYRLNDLLTPIRVGIRAVIDGAQHCVGAVAPRSGGLLQAWCNNAWQATAGPHTLLWQLDDLGEIDEANEGNNETEWTFLVGDPLGDANCDGVLGAADLIGLVTLLAEGERAECGLDDADASGTLDAADLDATIDLLFGVSL